ncbi:tyrosine-type recombinase/integrase [Palleronia sp.]|uniref:tyrosine-type recombinase/integrase n=1 Tax=Palleronia sp. TaxID=1940284 RepID=UPI0035C7A924
MPFRKKGSRFWHYDFQVRGRRFHGSCGTDDFQEAKAVEAEARVAAKAGNKAKRQGSFTVAEALGTYWSDVCQHQSSAGTAKGQASAILVVLPGKTPIGDLTTGRLFKMVAAMRADCANATANRRIDMLKRSMNHMGKMHDATVPDIDWKALKTKEDAERVRELTLAEQERLFEHLRQDLHPMVKFALTTGARRDAICSLKWADVDMSTNRVRFRQKGGGSYTVPMSPETRAILSALPRSNTMTERAYVFTFVVRTEGKHQGERRRITDGGHIWEEWRNALTTAEIDNFRFHDCRHTFATRLLRKTGNLKLVSRMLGHANIETTMRYAHVLDSDLADAMEAFTSLGPAVSPEVVGKAKGNQ